MEDSVHVITANFSLVLIDRAGFRRVNLPLTRSMVGHTTTSIAPPIDLCSTPELPRSQWVFASMAP